MADTLPPLPPGFTLDAPGAGNALPPLPPGFTLDSAPAAPPASSGIVANIGAGANDVIAGVIGTPGNVLDAMQSGVNALVDPALSRLTGKPPPPQPHGVLSTEGIKDIMGLIGADPRKVVAADGADRTARAVGHAIPMMVAPYLGARAAIERGVTQGLPGAAARLFGGPGGPGQSGVATTFGALGNAAVGAGGVVGGQIAESLLPDDSILKPLANFGGQLVGGGLVAGGMGASKGLLNYGAEQARSLLGPFVPSMRERLVGDMLRQNASNPAELAARLATDTPELVPGSRPTTFQLSGDLGIGQLERGLARKPESFPEFAVRAGEQNTARLGELAGLAPEGGAPTAVRDLLRERLRLNAAEEEMLVNTAQRDATQAFDAVGGRVSPDLSGALMREQMEAAKASAKAAEAKLWQAIDPDGTLRIGGLPVRQEANRIFSEIPQMAKPAAGEEAAVFGLARMLPEVMPFNEFAALRGRLLGAIREERAANGQTPALRRMQQLRESMDETIAGAAEQAAQADAGLLGRLSGDLSELGTAAQAVSAGQRYSPGAATLSGRGASAPAGLAGTAGYSAGGPGSAAGHQGVSRPPPKPQDIVEFLISRGGMRDDGGELRAMDTNRVQGGYGTGGVGQGSFGVLSRRNGRPPDEAREIAVEAGYLPQGATTRELYDAIHDSTRGIPRYSERDADIVANWEHYMKTGEAPPPLDTRWGNVLAGEPANFDAAAAQRYREAAGATRDRAQTFNNNIVGPVLQEQGGGGYRMFDSRVPERFISSPEGMQAFLSAGGRPETLQEALVADLRRTATDAAGNLNPTRFQSWRMRRQDALRAFPELDRRLGAAATAQQEVDTAAAAARTMRLDFERGAARHFLNAEPMQAVGAALGGRNPVADMRALAQMTAGDADAAAGLRRAVADYISRQYVGNTEVAASGQAGLKSDAFQTFVRRSEPALREVFTPDQMNALRAVAADLQRSNRSIASSKVPGGSDTAQNLAAQSRLGAARTIGGEAAAAGAGALGGWLLSGGSPMGAGAGLIAGRTIKDTASRLRAAGMERTEARLAEALLNPEIARTLLMMPSAANRPIIAQRLNQQLGTLLFAAPAEQATAKRH